MSEGEKDKREGKTEVRWQRLRDRLDRLDPSTVPDELPNLARAVAGVEDPDMQCDECRAWLASYVDADVGGLPAAELYPKVQRHLNLCADCVAEYLDMLELALAEEAGELPVPERFPAPDLSFLPPVSFIELAREMVTKVAKSVLVRLTPDVVGELDIISDVFFARVEELGGQFSLRRAPSAALGFGTGEASKTLLSLAATYETARRIAEGSSAQEIQARADQGEFADILARTAEQVAREMTMSRQEAREFARIYTESAGDEIGSWLALAEVADEAQD